MRQLIREFLLLPTSVKVMGIVLGVIFVSGSVLLIGIPAAILLIAFPKLWIIIGVLVILAIIGYKKGKE
jgi:hypothetical protein